MNVSLVSPGILGLAAAATPFALASDVWWTEGFVDPRPELAFYAVPLELFLVCLGLVITFYGVQSLIGNHYRASGGVVFACSLLSSLIVLPSALRALSLPDELIFAGYLASSSLGLLGGLKGIYWERSWKASAAVPELAEYSRWAIIGGIALLVAAPWTYPESLSFFGSLTVAASGAMVYKVKVSQRLLGLMIIAGALWASTPFWTYYGVLRLTYGVTIHGTLGFAGTFLSVIAGLKILAWKATRISALQPSEAGRDQKQKESFLARQDTRSQ